MTEVLHANVFFFVTGIAVIVLTAVLCILLFQIIRALKSVRRILGNIERGAEVLTEDVQSIRSYFVKGGLIGGIMSLLRGVTESNEEEDADDGPKKKTTSKKGGLRITDVTR